MIRDRTSHPKTQALLFMALLTLLVFALALTVEVWAAPVNSPHRQSVPTKTPLSGEAKAAKSLTPSGSLALPTPTQNPGTTKEYVSGGGSLLIFLGALVIVVAAAVALFWLRRRKR